MIDWKCSKESLPTHNSKILIYAFGVEGYATPDIGVYNSSDCLFYGVDDFSYLPGPRVFWAAINLPVLE